MTTHWQTAGLYVERSEVSGCGNAGTGLSAGSARERQLMRRFSSPRTEQRKRGRTAVRAGASQVAQDEVHQVVAVKVLEGRLAEGVVAAGQYDLAEIEAVLTA